MKRRMVLVATWVAFGVAGVLCAGSALAAVTDRSDGTVMGLLAAGLAVLCVGLAGSLAIHVVDHRRRMAGRQRRRDRHQPLWPAWPQPAAKADPPVEWADGGPGDERFARVWSGEVSRRASYMYKLAEAKRRERLLREFGASSQVMLANSKILGYELAQRCGVATPEIFIPKVSIEKLDFAALPDRCVMKTLSGSTNRGIYLLERQPDGRFRNLMNSAIMSADDVLADYRALHAEGLIQKYLTVEELLAPRADIAHLVSIPDDLKLWCFDDRVVCVMQRRMFGTSDKSKWRFRFWTEDWRDLGAVKYIDRLDPDLAPPTGGAAVVEAAQRLATELAVPFVRLDLYDTDRGPVFGEVTPFPGPPEVWRADVDELMGREWELAEARIMARGRAIVVPGAQPA